MVERRIPMFTLHLHTKHGIEFATTGTYEEALDKAFQFAIDFWAPIEKKKFLKLKRRDNFNNCDVYIDPQKDSNYVEIYDNESCDACKKKVIVILDKDNDYKPNYIVCVPKNVSTDEIQGLIWEVENKYPGEYDNEDLNEALMEKYGVSLEDFEEVIW